MTTLNDDGFRSIVDEADLNGVTDIHGQQLKVGDYIRISEYRNDNFDGMKGELMFIIDAVVEWVENEICYTGIKYEFFGDNPERNGTKITERQSEYICNLMKFSGWQKMFPIFEFEIISKKDINFKK